MEASPVSVEKQKRIMYNVTSLATILQICVFPAVIVRKHRSARKIIGAADLELI